MQNFNTHLAIQFILEKLRLNTPCLNFKIPLINQFTTSRCLSFLSVPDWNSGDTLTNIDGPLTYSKRHKNFFKSCPFGIVLFIWKTLAAVGSLKENRAGAYILSRGFRYYSSVCGKAQSDEEKCSCIPHPQGGAHPCYSEELAFV